MSRVPRKSDLRIANLPSWSSRDSRSDLIYLGWGLRDYGRHPTVNEGDRNEWSFTLILRGSPTILLSDGPHPLPAHHAVLFSGHGNYVLGLRDEPGNLSEVLIWTWRTPPATPRVRPAQGGYLIGRMSLEGSRQLATVHANCRREALNPDAHTPKFLAAMRKVIEIEFARVLSGTTSKPGDQARADLAVRWLKRNLGRENPIFHLCEYLQVSHSTVVRLFQTEVGQSPTAYHRRLRMEEAQHLMNEGKLTVKQVAYGLGYKYPGDFSRAFNAFRRSRQRFGD